MKYINFSEKQQDIQIIIEVGTSELVRDNLKSLIISRLPDEYRDKVFVADFVNYDKFKKVPNLPNATIVVSHDRRWQSVMPWVELKFDSKAIYLSIELEKLEKALLKVVHYLEHGEFPITQVTRKGFYPKNKNQVKQAFNYLHKFAVLGSDIEGTSLKFYENELVSIAFAVSEQKGITFHVKNCDFMDELKVFFETFQGKIVWHNGSYDVKALTYLLFNNDSRVLYRTYEDTMFLHFICTNSPERPQRDLGTLVEDLCGSYKLTKKEITDMMNLNVEKCCLYNLDDARGTLWLYNLYRTKIHSEYFYSKLKEWQWFLTQIELVGLPYRVSDLERAKEKVTGVLDKLRFKLEDHPYVDKVIRIMHRYAMEKYNAAHVGSKELHEIKVPAFNPNSTKHIKALFESVIGVISPMNTPNGNPSYGVKAYPHLKLAIENDPKALEVMDLLEEYSGYNQLYVTFLKPMLGNSLVNGDRATLHGNFNLARVVSGRISSSAPNLTNLPSKGALGKIFKEIISPPKGYLMGGADFASLEERVNTVLTKDPNKEAVYLKGYDGHSFRAFYYFPDKLGDLPSKVEKAKDEPEKVSLINSIKAHFDGIRSDSKPITFLLQYLGTAYGIRLNCGFPMEQALAIEANYHTLYVKSDEWLNKRLEEGAEQGYVEVAYGMRIYCPAISKSILNSSFTPKIVRKHIRTIGNGLCQSYCQMTVDAGMKFLKRVYAAGLEDRVFVSCTIHDALYPMWEDDIELTKWVNDNLIECMEDISELPELESEIPFPADLEIFMPNWAKMVGLPRFGTIEQLKEVLND